MFGGLGFGVIPKNGDTFDIKPNAVKGFGFWAGSCFTLSGEAQVPQKVYYNQTDM